MSASFLAPGGRCLQGEHGGCPQRAVPVVVLALGGRLGGHAGAGAAAHRARVVGVRSGRQHGGEAVDVGQGLGVVLLGHARRRDVHPPQQGPVTRHRAHRQGLL